MRVLVQRVSRASVAVDGEIIGSIAEGFLLLVGIMGSDSVPDCVLLANKVANLRVFDDENGNLNRSLLDLIAEGRDAAVLVVSQFTLYADVRKGRRPSFVAAASPLIAAPLITEFVGVLNSLGITVEQGRFGADMAVELINDGPVTIWMDTADLRR